MTGYSLGGHLATAFNLLRLEEQQAVGIPNPISATYTFNGAGVGEIKPGNTLKGVFDEFQALRTGGSTARFSDPDVLAFYQDLRTVLNGGATLSQIDVARSQVTQLLSSQGNVSPADPKYGELNILGEAVDRVRVIVAEALRVPGLTPGDGSAVTPLNIKPELLDGKAIIDATRLDYQLAVLFAGQNTQPSTGVIGGGIQAAFGREQGPFTIPNFYDLYGDTRFSAVANSQLHYGTGKPIFIEDQPLYRGEVIDEVPAESKAYHDLKLLVDGYANNDFGDTHSLVLMVDSLSVQSALARLDPSLTIDKVVSIFSAAANDKASEAFHTQGRADGNTLEILVNALADTLGLNWSGADRLSGSLQGNTWASIQGVGGFDGRAEFHARLKNVIDSPAFQALIGKAIITTVTGSLGTQAKTDFGAFLAPQTLSPFVISTNDTAALNALKAAQGSVGVDWQADKNARLYGDANYSYTFTDAWYQDRVALLGTLLRANTYDNQDATVGDTGLALDRVYEFDYFDADGKHKALTAWSPSNRRGNELTTLPRQRIAFGDDAADSLGGTDSTLGDHLYGGAGNDTLSGGQGADYLQGDADADSLDGGEGADMLYGGAGADTLAGGAGNDLLRGGADADTYQFSGAWGDDVIEDSDGAGSIEVDGMGTLSGAGALKLGDKNIWKTQDWTVTYALVATTNGRSDLLIAFAGRGDTLTVRNWQPGNLGITLTAEVTAPATSAQYTGDRVKLTNANGTQYLLNGLNYQLGSEQQDAQDVITGSDADERILGLGGADGLSGGKGDDSIEGGEGGDLIYGGQGADTLLGGAGNDFIFGWQNAYFRSVQSTTELPVQTSWPIEVGRGFSWAVSKAGADGTVYLMDGLESTQFDGTDEGNYIDAGDGDDVVQGGDSDDIIFGGVGNDQLGGMQGADQVFGEAGNDLVWGDADPTLAYLSTSAVYGDDLLSGGSGADTLLGMGGSDQLYGGDDDDQLLGDNNYFSVSWTTAFAEHGNDLLDGGAGHDQLSGDGGDDTLQGGTGNDSLWGDDSSIASLPAQYHGRDSLDGGEGDDYLEGGGKDDTLVGGTGNDMLWGDASTSGLTGTDNGADTLDGGAGSDSLIGGGAGDTLYGGTGNDYLWGDGDLVATADQGDDYLHGGDGNDGLYGNGGNDTLVGGAGTDLLYGGAGDDTYIIGASDSPQLAGGIEGIVDDEGNNTLILRDALLSQVKLGAIGGDLTLNYGDGNVIGIRNGLNGSVNTFVFADGTSLDLNGLKQRFSGASDAADSLQGTSGDDLLYGGLGVDTISGGAGNDTLEGGVGKDTLSGGVGNDTYLFGKGDGVDTIAVDYDTSTSKLNVLQFKPGVLPSEVVVTRSGSALVLCISGTTDKVVVQGFFLPDALTGSYGAYNPIQQIRFADGTAWNLGTILGRWDQQAQLLGTDGDDHLIGGSGDDPLQGGLGNDYLEGGAGSDTYFFDRGDGQDVIGWSAPGAGEVDTIRFGVGILPSDIEVSGQGNSVRLIVRGTTDAVTINGYQTNAVQQIVFADGTTWTRSMLVERAMSGSSGDDSLAGTATDDQIHGGLGFLHAQVGDGACARGAVADGARCLLRRCGQFARTAPRRGGVDQQDQRIPGRQDERLHVGDRVEAGLADGGLDTVGARQAQQRVAVRCGAHHVRRTDVAAGARPVVHHHGAVEPLGEALGQQPRRRVSAATGREGHDQRDRAGRIAGLGDERRRQRRQRAAGQALDELSAKHLRHLCVCVSEAEYLDPPAGSNGTTGTISRTSPPTSCMP